MEESLIPQPDVPQGFRTPNDLAVIQCRVPTTSVGLAARLVDARRASLMLPSSKDGLLRIAAATGIDNPIVESVRVRLGEPVAGMVALNKRPVLVNDRHARPAHPKRGYLTGSFISVPVPLDGDSCGVLSVADPRNPDGFQEDDLRSLEAFTDQVAAGLEFHQMSLRANELEGTVHHLRRQMIDVQEAERQRIARDLHDEAGHALTAAVLRLDVEMTRRAEDCAAVAVLNQARGELVECSKLLHAIAFNLRPRILEDFGLHAALRSLARYTMEQSDLKVSVEVSGEDWALAETEELVIFRVVQESLTNVRKHARASQVRVMLEYTTRWLTVHIDDNGIGLRSYSAGQVSAGGRRSMGISGMRERVELVDGTFWIGLGPSGGTLVSVLLPR